MGYHHKWVHFFNIFPFSFHRLKWLLMKLMWSSYWHDMTMTRFDLIWFAEMIHSSVQCFGIIFLLSSVNVILFSFWLHVRFVERHVCIGIDSRREHITYRCASHVDSILWQKAELFSPHVAFPFGKGGHFQFIFFFFAPFYMFARTHIINVWYR